MRAITPPRVAWTTDAFHVFARSPLRRSSPLVSPRAATVIGDARALGGGPPGNDGTIRSQGLQERIKEMVSENNGSLPITCRGT
ncbi:unnamed protein product, partial [Musa banksii]